MTSASIETILQFISFVLAFCVVVRLIQFKLYRTYPFFFALLSLDLFLQTVVVIYNSASYLFLWCFVVLEPVRNILYILVVWELFSVIFRNYAGLRSLSRWVMGVASVIASGFFVLTLFAAGTVVFNASAKARMVLKVERGVALGLVIFIVIMLYFISRYPIRLPRNNVVLCMLYSIWFLVDAAVLLVASRLPKEYVSAENKVLALMDIGAYLGWAVLLSRAGELQETRIRREISAEHEQALIGELNAMNEMLLRAGRSISHTR